MTTPFDVSLFVTVLSFIFATLTGLIYIGRENLLIMSQKGILHEFSLIYNDTLAKAERYSHGANVTGRKLRIKRCLGRAKSEYAIPKSVMTVSGLSAIGWILCFALAIAGFVISSTKSSIITNIALLTPQCNIITMGVIAWFCSKTRIDVPILFLLLCGLLWIISAAFVVGLTLAGWYFHVISEEYMPIAFIVILAVPLIPIFVGIVDFICYLCETFKKFKMLKAAVKDFELHRNDVTKKKK